jgi:hypothetical protein
MINNKEHSNPLDSIIDFAGSCGANQFWIHNAKDELKKLRKTIDDFDKILSNPVAWAKINSSGDLFDISLQYNPYDTIQAVPLYKK